MNETSTPPTIPPDRQAELDAIALANAGRLNNGIPNGTYPLAQYSPEYRVGMLVALYHNPRIPCRILSMSADGFDVVVQYSDRPPLTVAIARIKPLIPQL